MNMGDSPCCFAEKPSALQHPMAFSVLYALEWLMCFIWIYPDKDPIATTAVLVSSAKGM